ncbi:hypothetical protein GGF43_002183 [Coemansia sp. RSA 2618]|nr:hypothetical protein GGF43_002183 [Coemansia sp. RSA 2618]
MHKLSQHVKGCFTMKRRRRSDTSNSDSGEQRSSSEMTIVHVSMEESRRNTQTLKETRGGSVPMNYWMMSDDDDDESDASSVYSDNVPSREPSYVDVLSDSETNFMPLRSVPKPKNSSMAKETTVPKTTNIPRAANIPKAASVPKSKPAGRRFSRDEWQEKAGEALFGSCRNNTGDESAESDDMWSGQATPQVSGISLRAGQSPYKLCSSALNELLFSTNAQIDGDLHDMVEDYISGRGISNLTDDFEAIVDHAYSGFITAARAILDITEETQIEPPVNVAESRNAPPALQRYPSSKYAGSMESLLNEIVDCYTHQTEDESTSYARGPSWRFSHNRTSPRQSSMAEKQMGSYGIDVIKYNKDQVRRYALTSLSKYISGQVLLSTGIENDLADKLDESAEALRMITQQISTLESLYEDKSEMKNNTDLAALRKKAFRYRRSVKQLKIDAKDASNVRRIFEMALLEIQIL